MSKQWFDVDKTGLGKQAEEHGKGRLIGELVQNALDEAGVTPDQHLHGDCSGPPLSELTVEDDSPEVFGTWPMHTRSLPRATSVTTRSSGANSTSARSWSCRSAKRHTFPRPRAWSSSIPRRPHREARHETVARLRFLGPYEDDQGGVPAGVRLSAIPALARRRRRSFQWRATAARKPCTTSRPACQRWRRMKKA